MKNRRKVFIVIGPPLSGKSTFIREKIHISENHIFSVRAFFEKERQNKDSLFKLPPVGNFLSNEMVYSALEIWINQLSDENDIAFDGFPGNEQQMKKIQEILFRNNLDVHYIWLGISCDQAYERMKNRKVCFYCDGGVMQATEYKIKNHCDVCAQVLQKRLDDTEAGFQKRWKGFEERKKGLLECSEMKIDLHVHSDASDGAWTLEEIFHQAFKKKISFIAITDHDTMRNVALAKKIGKRYGIGCISGMEMSGIWRNQEIHILGYGMREDSIKILEYEKECEKRKKKRDLDALKSILDEKRCNEYILEYEKYTYPHSLGGWKLLNFLIEKGIISNGEDYCELEKNHIIEEVKYYPVEYVIDLIHSCGGYAVIAHPGSYKQINYRELLSSLMESMIDGVEVFHPHNKKEIVDYCLSWAIHNKKIITGGSDSHGNLSDRSFGKPDITFKQLNLKKMINFIE